ncbi:MAG: flagellar basal body L-ring protein FlgH [Mariniblastus sp.]
MSKLICKIRTASILLCVSIIAGSVSTFATPVSAQQPSLWQRRNDRMTDLFADVKARRKGDLLFITINEQSDIENRDQRLLRKQNLSTSEGSGTYGAGGGLGTANGSLSFDQATAANRQFNGNTEYRSAREFIDRFTVTVIDTLPNGNLLIEGRRNVSLEGDNRTLVLSGIVRGADVSMLNVVSSRMVSNLSLKYESTSDGGAEKRFINQGWLGRKFNKFWPH